MNAQGGVKRPGALPGSEPSGAGTQAERYLPGGHGPLIAYEHIHRYTIATTLIAKGRVLDLASGSGYGSQLLRSAGCEVVSVDIALTAARRATPSVCANAERLPFPDESFDAVVCFEAVEHMPDPSLAIAEIHRVLRRSGVAFISTPNRRIYTDRIGNRNPHHLCEMSFDEFAMRIRKVFSHSRFYGQSVWAGSWIAELGESEDVHAPGIQRRVGVAVSDTLLDSLPAERAPWAGPSDDPPPTPIFVIAVCSRRAAVLSSLRSTLGPNHLLHDSSQCLLGRLLQMAQHISERDLEIHSHAAHAENLAAQVSEREERVAGLEMHAENLTARVSEREERIAGLETHTENLAARVSERDERIVELKTHAENLTAQVSERDERIVELKTHAENLAAQVVSLSEGADTLERAIASRDERIAGLEEHAANLEVLAAERSEHIAALEDHAANLERVREGLESEHETHSRALEAQIESARSELEELYSHLVVRALRKFRSLRVKE